jgi:hypothetical protein
VNKKLLLTMFSAVIIFALVGGVIWLTRPPAMPPAQTVEQSIPDDHIPR